MRGNFADVLKHAVLARLIVYLQQKDKAFRLLDTHAGIGLYDLSSEEAQEDRRMARRALAGFSRRTCPPPSPPFSRPISTPCAASASGAVTLYPGSPKLARMLFRPQDRLSAMELHPDDSRRLARLFEGDYQVRVTELDGWLALGAHICRRRKSAASCWSTRRSSLRANMNG